MGNSDPADKGNGSNMPWRVFFRGCFGGLIITGGGAFVGVMMLSTGVTFIIVKVFPK